MQRRGVYFTGVRIVVTLGGGGDVAAVTVPNPFQKERHQATTRGGIDQAKATSPAGPHVDFCGEFSTAQMSVTDTYTGRATVTAPQA